MTGTPDYKKDFLLLFLVGACLSIAQFVMVRDFVTILYGEEVVIVLVTAAFFSGLSLGYCFALRFNQRLFERLFAASVFLHLSFPLSYRYLAVWISGFPHLGGWAYLALLFFYAFLFSALFAAFLPRLVERHAPALSPENSLKWFYSIELTGFLAGFVIVGLSWNHPVAHLLPAYWILLCVVLHLVLRNRGLTAGFAAMAFVASIFLEGWDLQSAALLYERKHGKKEPQVLMAINSPYQRVEVIQDGRGEKYLYLDGLLNLNATDLEFLNHYIARIPARLISPENTLIVGNGTLSSVGDVAALSRNVVSVELDPGVLLAGSRFFTPPESLTQLANWNLVVDDGKHFLKTTEKKFDLIIMDVPSPLTIQEACLHTVEFYKLAREKITPSGVIAVQLSGPLQRNNRTPARVVAALAKVFKEVMVVESKRADRGFAYASDRLPFSPGDLIREARSFESALEIIPANRVHVFLDRAVPLSLDNMDLVLGRGWERFFDRYFGED
ncbi:MAG: hypothetical protein COV67_00625 [Nitrospinae bacterium CG11_big_fil_rev_8_21_14_0_20_56_8]|nr:MAG: hypothetical protein COV67_00625 [Nitrospinae bacterium CG11_big_fil_rev_8_21_14_0_20_56_8]